MRTITRGRFSWKIRYWSSLLLFHYLFGDNPARRIYDGKIKTIDYSVAWQRKVFDDLYQSLRDAESDDYYHASILIGQLVEFDPIRMAPDAVRFLEASTNKRSLVWRANRSRFEEIYRKLSLAPLKDEDEKTVFTQTFKKLQAMKQTNWK